MATDACLAGGRVRDKVIAGEVESTANLEEVIWLQVGGRWVRYDTDYHPAPPDA